MTIDLRSISRAVVLLVLGVVLAMPAAAADLFAGPASPAARVADIDGGARKVLRQRLLVVDPAAIAAQILPPKFARSASRAAISRSLPAVLQLGLFADATVTARRSAVEDGLDGGVVWTGEPEGSEGYVILVVNGNRIAGTILANGRTYQIEPAGAGNVHRVYEYEGGAMPGDEQVVAPGGKSGQAIDGLPPAGRAIVTIRLMAAYTQASLADLAGTPSQTIQLDVALANQALTNSGIPARFQLVGTKGVSASFVDAPAGGGNADTLRALKKITSGTTDNFGAIRRARNTLKADLVTLYASTDPAATQTCGVGWLLLSQPAPLYGFSVINSPCKGTLTLAHELGHNLGADHDRFVLPPKPNSAYNFGYVDLVGAFYEVMAYPNKCTANALFCTHIPYYSTPNRTYGGRPIGIPAGQVGAADATRRLKATYRIVAAYR